MWLILSQSIGTYKWQCIFWLQMHLRFHNYWLEDTQGAIRSVFRRTNNTLTYRKGQKDKKLSTKTAQKTKDWATRTQQKTWVSSGARRVALVTNIMTSHEWGKDREVGDIGYGCHLHRHLHNILYLLSLYDDVFVILY